MFRRLKMFFEPSRFTKVKKALRTANPKKLVVGGSSIKHEGSWISTDLDILDVTDVKNWMKLLGNEKLDNVFAEHVWEHLTVEQGKKGIENIFKYLKSGGVFRIAIPDGYKPDEEYINYVKPGGFGPGADDHKVLYNYQSLSLLLSVAGFKVSLLEYWDELGVFHHEEWNEDRGKVLRSKNNDSRNSHGKLKYTSLIIDAIKP